MGADPDVTVRRLQFPAGETFEQSAGGRFESELVGSPPDLEWVVVGTIAIDKQFFTEEESTDFGLCCGDGGGFTQTISITSLSLIGSTGEIFESSNQTVGGRTRGVSSGHDIIITGHYCATVASDVGCQYNLARTYQNFPGGTPVSIGLGVLFRLGGSLAFPATDIFTDGETVQFLRLQ